SLRAHSRLSKLQLDGVVATREGVIRGKGKKKKLPALRSRRILNGDSFPNDTFMSLDATSLPLNQDEWVDAAASTDFSAFDLPHLIIKQSWLSGPGRFRAALVNSTTRTGGVLCSDSYVSVCALNGNRELLETVWLVASSSFATYYQLL